MSLSCQYAARQCARALRSSPATTSRCIAAQSYRSRDIQSRRWQSTDAAAAPSNPKIAGIVDQISKLTLLETADLVSSLKVCVEQYQGTSESYTNFVIDHSQHP